ncbi:hypothetical protein [uncultured Flavobacterium sp.]|uniref:hypothetical protein n=1 Tax=uncultured Flavobacterium sp. TaxID=165435 RepID=UPI0025CF475E|nr:hypothetical protein [uncultured Flavobacterium sp.]
MKSNKKNDKSKLQNLACSRVEERESTGKLTLDELIKCEGFANASATEGLEIIENLYKLSLIAFNYEAKK